MTIRIILAPVRGDGRGEAVLGLAVALARRFRAHIDVVHVHSKPEDLLPFGVPVPGLLRQTILDAVAHTSGQEESYVRDLFRQFCASHDVVEVDHAGIGADDDSVTASWREEAGKQAQVVSRLGRLADLVVVARPEADGSLGRNTFDAALFDVGKLTAIAPPSEVADAGRHVAIAWNGSAEAARAVTLALPVLARAERVTVLAGGGSDADPGIADLRRYLGSHGLAVETHDFRARRRDVGGPLLAAAGELGADLLLMGAFGSDRRRELVLGGVTQHVIEHAELPVLMAH